MSETEYIYHPSFSLPEAEERFFGADAKPIEIPCWRDFFTLGCDDALPSPSRKGKVKAHEEKTLFLRYNYVRYRLARLVKGVKPAPGRVPASPPGGPASPAAVPS